LDVWSGAILKLLPSNLQLSLSPLISYYHGIKCHIVVVDTFVYRSPQTRMSLRYQNIRPVNISYIGSVYFLANDI
jgi:hypothetical protein